MKLHSRVVAVTGGGRGLGLPPVQEAAVRGATRVAVIYLDGDGDAAGSMKTPMLATAEGGNAYVRRALESAVTPAEAAVMCLDAVEADRLMAISYPPVADEFAAEGQDYEACIEAMQRVHAEVAPEAGRLPARGAV
jgi:NAD(P)-dependent dehydrogenase (short-subunit alcohol dehydrogenase family)